VRWRSAGLHDLADEVVQDTWLIAVKRIRSFDPGRASFAAWLRGIAAKVLRNHLRKRTRRQSAPAPSPNGRPVGEAADGVLERQEEAERIAGALAELPEHYEAVLRAKYVEGMECGPDRPIARRVAQGGRVALEPSAAGLPGNLGNQ